ncbi:RNA 2',3'-cyclic phosphodiesterase [Candidatus Woesearchaeota archaeon]|nr:MAG: RNA 2',3'-cyclic phosphodiesterase [Candidatus Woesearchaeota archaeon]
MRLFVAITLPKTVQQLLHNEQAKLASVEGAVLRYPQVKKAHLTLAFLGEKNKDELPTLISSLQRIHQEPFTLTTSHRGFFKRGGKPAVFWLGIVPSAQLSKLQNEVAQAVNLKEDRPFHPHLTLARAVVIKRHKGLHEWHGGRVKPLTFDVDAFHLFQSTLTPRGPEYLPLATFPLTKTRARKHTTQENGEDEQLQQQRL